MSVSVPAMTLSPFEAPRLKLDRAGHHIRDVDHAIKAYLDRKPFRAVLEPGKMPDQINITFRVREAVPAELTAMIGDVVHNLRASLDILASDLVGLNGGDTKGVYFPFCDNGAALKKTIKKSHINRAAPEAVDVIRSLKPDKRGNAKLRALHDLEIMDQHKAIIPLGDLGRFHGLPAEISRRVSGVGVGPVRDGSLAWILPALPTLKLGQEIPATYRLVFDPSGPLGMREIVPELHDLANLVADIVESFHALGLEGAKVE